MLNSLPFKVQQKQLHEKRRRLADRVGPAICTSTTTTTTTTRCVGNLVTCAAIGGEQEQHILAIISDALRVSLWLHTSDR